jgi:hypothetical protein
MAGVTGDSQDHLQEPVVLGAVAQGGVELVGWVA